MTTPGLQKKNPATTMPLNSITQNVVSYTTDPSVNDFAISDPSKLAIGLSAVNVAGVNMGLVDANGVWTPTDTTLSDTSDSTLKALTSAFGVSINALVIKPSVDGNHIAQLVTGPSSVWVPGGPIQQVTTTTHHDVVPPTINTVKSTIPISDNTTSIDTNIQKMRTRGVVLVSEFLKPFTQMFCFMNATDITQYVFPCEEILFTSSSGNFFGINDVNLSTSDITKRTGNNAVYDFGEIVNGSSGSAVVVAHRFRTNKTTKLTEQVLVIVNRIGTLSGTITGTLSATTGVVSSVSTPSVLQTDSAGNLYALFRIPDGVFDTGSSTIKVMDVSGNYTGSESKGEQGYYSKGTLHSDSRVVTYSVTTTTTGGSAAWDEVTTTGGGTTEGSWASVTPTRTLIAFDPLAQTFSLPDSYPNGAFIHSVDLYFAYKKPDESLPVLVEITDVASGYPGTNTLTAVVLDASKINAENISGRLVATRVEFFRLIFLEAGKEYAIKILSNSNYYKIYKSTINEIDVRTKAAITKQPNLGSLFTSQNNSTWTPDQYSDLTFTLNAAQFDIKKTAQIDLVSSTTKKRLVPNPFFTTSGQTVVRVRDADHCYLVGDNVAYSGCTDTRFNATFIVKTVSGSDSYTISLPSAASVTGYTGGNSIESVVQVRADVIRPFADVNVGSSGSIRGLYKYTDSTRSLVAAFADIVTNAYNVLDTPASILTPLNEQAFLNSTKSLQMRYLMSSTNTQISPAINISGVGVDVITNRCDALALSSLTDAIDLISVVSSNTHITTDTTITYNGAFTTTDTATIASLSTLKVGKYITVSGATSGNNGTTIITNIVYSGSTMKIYVNKTLVSESSTSISISQYNMYVNDIAPTGSSSEAVYQSIPIKVINSSTGITATVETRLPIEATFTMYYRTVLTSSFAKIDDQVWHPFTGTTVTPDPNNSIDRTFSVASVNDFDTYQTKIVSTTTNSAKVPVFKNLRVIVLA